MASMSVSTTTVYVPQVVQPQRAAETVTLRLVPRRKKKSVKWSEDVVEVNENSGKQKSKKCCIFHKQRVFGEWSDDEDSDSECAQCIPAKDSTVQTQ